MQTRTLKIRDIQILNEIQKALSEHRSLTENQQNELSNFLSQLPLATMLLEEKIPLDEPLQVGVWNMEQIDITLQKWITLFENIPGSDYCPCCLPVYGNEKLLRNRVVLIAFFAPSLAYNRLEENDAYEVWLKDDGSAIFQLPILRDVEQYPELYNFRGTWKEAYLLLIETLKKGWPMEEFPEELKPFLKT